MERYTDKLPLRLIEFKKEFVNDVELKELNISQRTLATPALKTKWLMIYLEEKNMLKKLRDKKKDLSEKYINEHGKPGVPRIVTEKALERSNELIQLDDIIFQQSLVVEFLENTLKIITSYTYDIKNAIEIIKVESQ